MVIMVTVGVMSAFMNNVGAVAVLMPAVIGVSRQTNVPASKLLIPLAFSSLMGGNMTLIGTPPNILATNILAAKDLPTFSFWRPWHPNWTLHRVNWLVAQLIDDVGKRDLEGGLGAHPALSFANNRQSR